MKIHLTLQSLVLQLLMKPPYRVWRILIMHYSHLKVTLYDFIFLDEPPDQRTSN